MTGSEPNADGGVRFDPDELFRQFFEGGGLETIFAQAFAGGRGRGDRPGADPFSQMFAQAAAQGMGRGRGSGGPRMT